MSFLQPFGWKSKKFDPNHEQKLKNFHVVIWQIFFLHFLKKISVHVLLYKSSLDYNSLLKFFESFKKSNFKTLKKFHISIVIQIGSIKQNVDRKNSKIFWDKKNCQNEVVNFQNYYCAGVKLFNILSKWPEKWQRDLYKINLGYHRIKIYCIHFIIAW